MFYKMFIYDIFQFFLLVNYILKSNFFNEIGQKIQIK